MKTSRVLRDLDRIAARTFSFNELRALHTLHREHWEAPGSFRDFEHRLIAAGSEKVSRSVSGKKYRPITRYVLPQTSPYELAISLRPRSFLSHGTAAFLHGLISEPPIIYVNKEQSPKRARRNQVLSQDAVDRAFHRPQRVSNFVVKFGGRSIVLVAGQHTGEFGVEELSLASGRKIRATSLERTLVELTVRSAYAGGVLNVLRAFRAGRRRISVARLITTLQKFAYVYPYHQAVGFYLERAGFPEKDYGRLRQRVTLDFHLTHGTEKTRFHKGWRLHYPLALDR